MNKYIDTLAIAKTCEVYGMHYYTCKQDFCCWQGTAYGETMWSKDKDKPDVQSLTVLSVDSDIAILFRKLKKKNIYI